MALSLTATATTTPSHQRRRSPPRRQQEQPPPARLKLVDYSKRRANLPAKAQSERHLGSVLPRRVKSLDNAGRTSSPKRPFHKSPSGNNEGPPPTTRRAYANNNATRAPTSSKSNISSAQNRRPLSKAKSALEIVDWSKLETELDWQGHNSSEEAAALTNTRTDTNTKDDGSSFVFSKTKHNPPNSRHNIKLQHKHNHTHKANLHSSCTQLLRSSFMTKPLGMNVGHLSFNAVGSTNGAVNLMQDVSDITFTQTSPNPGPRRTRLVTTNNAVPTANDNSMDASMHLEDVFDGDNANDNCIHPNSGDNDSDNEASALLKRLSKEAQIAALPVRQGQGRNRFHQSMSALATTMTVSPSTLGSPGRQINQQDHSPMDDASFTFRRSSSIRQKHPQKSSLEDLPTWDGDFDSSLSTLSSPATNTNDILSSNNVPTLANQQEQLLRKKKNSLLAMNDDDDDEEESDDDDNNLLFLPKGLTPVKPSTPTLKMSSRIPLPDVSSSSAATSTADMDHDMSEYTEETFAQDDHVRGALRLPDAIFTTDSPTNANTHEQDPPPIMNFAVRSRPHRGRSLEKTDAGIPGTTRSSDEEDAMGDDTLKNHKRDQVIRSNTSFRERVKAQRKISNEEKQQQPVADRRRGDLTKQLSVSRLGCEYNRLQQTASLNLNSQSSDSQLQWYSNEAFTQSAKFGGGERNPRGIAATGPRRDRYRRQSPKKSNRAASPPPPESPVYGRRGGSPDRGGRRQVISRAKSFDEVTPAGAAKSGRGGFRESLIRQTSFMTGSRIRRIGNDGVKSSSNLHNSLNLSGVFNYHSGNNSSSDIGKNTQARHHNSTGTLLEFE